MTTDGVRIGKWHATNNEITPYALCRSLWGVGRSYEAAIYEEC